MNRQKHFTRSAARALIQRRIRLEKPYANDVPAGTIGTVVAAAAWPARPAEYDLVVNWSLPPRHFNGRRRAFTDFLTLEEYSRCAQEEAMQAPCPGGRE